MCWFIHIRRFQPHIVTQLTLINNIKMIIFQTAIQGTRLLSLNIRHLIIKVKAIQTTLSKSLS